MKNIILIISVFFLASGTISHAEELITPFGNLEWTDGLTEVIQKLQKIEGINKIELEYMNSDEIDITNIDGEEKIIEALNQAIKSSRLYFSTKKGGKDRIRSKAPFYMDKDNNEQRCFQDQLRIVAEPVMILGVPYKLKIEFTPHPGLAIVNPEKVLFDKELSISFPFALETVTLLSKSLLLQNNYREINKILENKYRSQSDLGSFRMHDNNVIRGSSARDSKGNSVYVEISNDIQSDIRYSSGYLTELNRSYNEHLAQQERNKHAGQKDMSSGL